MKTIKETIGILGFMKVVADPGRRTEYWIVNDEKAGYCGKILEFLPDAKSSIHAHKLKTETFFVQSGSMTLLAGNNLVTLKPGGTYHIPAGTWHQIQAGPDGVVLFEFSTPHYDEDTYRREEKIAVSNVTPHWLTDEEIAQLGEYIGFSGSSVVQHVSGWYFWNETWFECFGPFVSREEAEEVCEKYARQS